MDELGEKYIVIKREDVKNYLYPENIKELNKMLKMIANARFSDGKPRSNDYVVLNMEDPFSLSVFYKEIPKVSTTNQGKIRDYAPAVVNAIRYSKRKTYL